MDTTATFTQSTYDAILHAYSKLVHANDVLKKQAVALTHLSAVQADLVRAANKDRDAAIESRLKMEIEVLALRQRAEMAEATSARPDQQLEEAAQDQLKVQRESELQLVLQEKDSQDSSAEATNENKARTQQKQREETVAAPSKTSTTPRKKPTTGQDERARVLASVKDVAIRMGAGPTAGSRARVRPTATARARVGATASTASTRARVEATAAFRAALAATAGLGASTMLSAKDLARVEIAGSRATLGNGC